MKKTSVLVQNALIGAIYVVLTVIPMMFPGLGSFLYGSVQFRISEALMILPFLLPKSYWGLFVGCALANYIGVGFGFTMPIDIVVGSLTTLAAAYATSFIKNKYLVPLPAIVFNAVVIGVMLTLLFPLPELSFGANALLFGAQVGFGQTVVCYCLGLPLLEVLRRRGFGTNQSIARNKV